MDPTGYIESNSHIGKSCKKFIEEVTSDWGDMRCGTVMDIGCGPGNTSTYWIDHYFPDIGRLIIVDIDPGMIALAKEKYPNGKFEFFVADMMKKESLKDWEGCSDKIISTFVLHRAHDQKLAFRNILALLKPSGKAALWFHTKGPYYSAVRELIKMPKWKPILEATNFTFPEGFIKEYDASHYRQMFEEVGFRVSVCETRTETFSFDTDDICKSLLMSLHDIGDVSNEMKEEYKTELFTKFLKHIRRNSEGQITHPTTMLYAKLYKDD